MELSSHDPYQHVVPQVDKFINAIDNPGTRNKVIDWMYDTVSNDELLKMKTRQAIGQGKDIHKFLADLITTPPIITIIIEKDTDQLEEALRKYAQKKVVEFQTFTREGIGLAVHAHLFEPLYKEIAPIRNQLTAKNEDIDSFFIFVKVENFWIKYKRLRIASEYLAGLSLVHDMSFDLETDAGVIKTKIDKWNEICVGMGKWYKAHPELKVGDLVTFRVLQPKNKYRLEIDKRRF